MSHSNRPLRPLAVLAAVLAATIAATPSGSPVHAANPGVRPPQSEPYGHSYGEWGARWWKWAFSVPAADNPLFDSNGANCAAGQSGPVWFLAGSGSSGVTTRSCTIPAGKGLFFPVINAEDNPAEEGVFPIFGTDLDDMQAGIEGWMDNAADLHAAVDGHPVSDVAQYRAGFSPFSITAPCGDGNLWDLYGYAGLCGTTSPAVTDGYWLMLAPLSAGDHTVTFGGSLPDFGFSLDLVYHLHVAP